jgi:hypothetical protein
MKKLLSFALLAFLMSSCAPKVERFVSYFDYTPVTEAYGVHFTESDAVSFDYEALGSLCVVETSGVVTTEYTDPKGDDAIYGPTKATKKEYQKASGQSVLQLLAQEAKKAGGDYILKLSIRPTKVNSNNAYEASGMVVKRK